MGDLTVTGLDEDVLARLSSRAAAHGRSVEAEVRLIIAEVVDQLHAHKEVRQKEWLASAAESRRQTGRLSIKSIDLLHDSRDERLGNL